MKKKKKIYSCPMDFVSFCGSAFFLFFILEVQFQVSSASLVWVLVLKRKLNVFSDFSEMGFWLLLGLKLFYLVALIIKWDLLLLSFKVGFWWFFNASILFLSIYSFPCLKNYQSGLERILKRKKNKNEERYLMGLGESFESMLD